MMIKILLVAVVLLLVHNLLTYYVEWYFDNIGKGKLYIGKIIGKPLEWDDDDDKSETETETETFPTETEMGVE